MVAPNHPLHTHTPIQSMTMMSMALSSVLIIHSLKMMARLMAMVSMLMIIIVHICVNDDDDDDDDDDSCCS